MQIADAIGRALTLSGDVKRVPDPAFSALLNHALAAAKKTPPPGDLYSAVGDLPRAVATEIADALLAFVLEAAKHNVDATTITSALEDAQLQGPRADLIASEYSVHVASIRAALRTVSFELPHVVDLKWRLDYHVKNNMVEKVDEASFLVSLTTQENGKTVPVQFSCSLAQLQDLVTSLKDAAKCTEGIASGY